MTTRASDLAGGFPGKQPNRIPASGLGCRDFSKPAVFSFPLRLSRCRDLVRVAFPCREAPVPGGGPGRLPAPGQAVRALAATARATAALVAAGSARMTTLAPVMVLAVSLGAIQMTRQPEAARRVMSFCPSACWVPL
jgi:hypothetical protein